MGRYADDAALDAVHFAWAGSVAPGERHYYRLQGPRLLIEWDNTQRNVNHAHAAWRDPEADFGLDSATTVLSSTGSRAAGVGLSGAGASSRVAVAVRDRPPARPDFSSWIGESFFARIVGARVGRVRGALGIRLVSGGSAPGQAVTARVKPGSFLAAVHRADPLGAATKTLTREAPKRRRKIAREMY